MRNKKAVQATFYRFGLHCICFLGISLWVIHKKEYDNVSPVQGLGIASPDRRSFILPKYVQRTMSHLLKVLDIIRLLDGNVNGLLEI